MKRLIIYFHYDAQGLLDEPCRFAVQALLPCGNLLLVTNGTLRTEDHEWLKQAGIRHIERENVGLDVGAYREALLTTGRETVSSYEEVVLMNFTLAGPVSPLQPMFSAMEERPALDFWGLTRHYAMKSRRFGGNVPEHLQSHFLAVRASLLKTELFWKYWQEMPLPHNYEESIIRHETKFTSYFAARGFTWDSYVQTEDLKPIFVNPIMACPRELIEYRGCPFFKRRSFFTDYEDELRRTDGGAARELCDYLRQKTEYPLDDLLRVMLQRQTLSALSRNLHWHYVTEEAEPVSVNLAALGLAEVSLEPLRADPVTTWYLQQSKQWAAGQLAKAAQLFAAHPMLGVLCPELPSWPQAVKAAQSDWKQQGKPLQGQVKVPLDDNPPPAPLAGWALVRLEAFPQGLPEQTQPWLLPLVAQQNGYYTATWESASRSAVRDDHWKTYVRAANEPTAVAKQLGRLIKHRLKR